jgi:hypothetical protein
MALLATDTETPLPLGVGATELWTRQGGEKQKRDNPNRESARWLRLVEQVESKRPAGSLVHVMDREGESFELMNRLKQTRSRFVLRMRAGRLVADERGRDSNEVLSGLNGLCVRDVALTRRGKNSSKLGPEGQKKHLPRNQRRATLEFSATSLTLKRPRQLSKTCLPLEMEINVVQVREINVPEG